MDALRDDSEKGQLLPEKQPRLKTSPCSLFVAAAAAAASFYVFLPQIIGVLSSGSCGHSLSHASTVATVQQCAIDNLKADTWFLEDAVPIKADEFVERQDRMAKALAADGIDAFVVEPGYTFQ